MEKALAEGPGAGSPSSLPLPPPPSPPGCRPGSSSLHAGNGVSGSGPDEWRAGGVRRRCGWVRGSKGTGTKWGAQVILPASSRSLQPSADTQQQRAGGGVRGREGKGERQSWCCRCPQGPVPAGRVAPRGTGSGTRGSRVGRSALAPPRPMVRSSHPGRRRVRGRAQRRSRCQASCPPASLCLIPAHPH